jgi:hypothetical protein
MTTQEFVNPVIRIRVAYFTLLVSTAELFSKSKKEHFCSLKVGLGIVEIC